MSGFWNMIGTNLIEHAEAYSYVAIAVLVAAAKCLPKPGSPFNGLTIYTWLYDTVQALIPVPRNSQSGNGSSSGVTPPTLPVYPPPTGYQNPTPAVANPPQTK